MKIFQFIPHGSTKLMHRLVSRVGDGVVGILDLEDGLLDLEHPDLTIKNKDTARKTVIELTEIWRREKVVISVGIRLNSEGTSEFEKDLSVLRALMGNMSLGPIVLSKISRRDQLERALEVVLRIGVRASNVVPVIESVDGLNNLGELAQICRDWGVHSVAFGIYDYCLECGDWPFPRPTESPYWKLIDRMTATLANWGLRYVHPPIPNLRDMDILSGVLSRLRQKTSGNFDIFSAGVSQTPILRALANKSLLPTPPGLLDVSDQCEQSRLEYALETCSAFRENKRNLHSFSADRVDHRFIPPHEYIAALRFLGGHDNE